MAKRDSPVVTLVVDSRRIKIKRFNILGKSKTNMPWASEMLSSGSSTRNFRRNSKIEISLKKLNSRKI